MGDGKDHDSNHSSTAFRAQLARPPEKSFRSGAHLDEL